MPRHRGQKNGNYRTALAQTGAANTAHDGMQKAFADLLVTEAGPARLQD